MPQKKNPDAAELVRGHSGRIVGCALSLMVTMKGLPLAYSKDMQDDKPPVFEAAGLLALSIAAMTGMVAEAGFRVDRMREAAELGYATATDLADWLVREAGVPFREAHHVTGAAVKLAEERGIALDQLPLADLQAIDARIDERVFAALSVEASVAARTSHGGTAPDEVRKRVAPGAIRARARPVIRTARLLLAGAVALGLVALPSCARRTDLQPAAGEQLPPPPYGRAVPLTSSELLELPPMAAPERRIELRSESEEREDDPFDLPPQG